MNKSGIAIILLCFLAAAAVVLWERRKVIKTMEEIERMLDAAMTGSFSETTFDESQLSALETKFAHYLSACLLYTSMRTPLTSIIGYSDTLRHVKLKDEQKDRALEHINREGRCV